jgi:two-component system nitrogen regulation sensor histidine kinase NtrY
MKENRRRLILVISAVLLLIGAMMAESIYFSDFEYRYRTRRFNRILAEKEKMMAECIEGMKPFLASGVPHGSMSEKRLFMLAAENEITILEYIDKKLVHWSDNEFDVPREIQNDSVFIKPIVFIQNGWFLPLTLQAGNEMVVGLMRVRTDYGFENDIVQNGFQKDFRIPDEVGFSTVKGNSEYNIYNTAGDFLFSLAFPSIKSNTILIVVPLILWTAFFVIIILLVLELVKMMADKGLKRPGIAASLAIFVLLYLFVLFTKRPAVIFRTGFFSPYIFSLNSLIPSLGHLLLISILGAVFSFCVYKYLPVKATGESKKIVDLTILSLLYSSGAMFSAILHFLFIHLISDSNISFETYRVMTLTFFSAAGFCSIILLALVPFFLVLKASQLFNVTLKRFILPFFISLIVLVSIFFSDPVSLLVIVLFFTGMVFLIILAGKKKIGYLNLTVLFSVLLGLYSLYVITVYSDKKNTENLKVQSLSFSTENDPEAEHLLLDMWPVINSDSALAVMMKADIFSQNDINRIQKDVNAISTYVHEKYFAGYWGNFNVNIVLCKNDGPLRIGPAQDDIVNCFDFFYGRTRKYGHRLTGTDFYFIDYQGGRSYYIGRIFFDTSKGNTNGLFIELYSNVTIFQPGYSELLLDKKFRGYSGLKDYSFAKYINGKMVLNSGEFAYNKEDDDYIDKNSDYRYFNAGSYKHVLYRNGNATVIISRKRLTAGDIIISFAYLFTFILLFSNLLLMLIRKPEVKGYRSLNFRQKLQLSFIGILLFSFILTGVVVTSLTINEYRSKHYDTIREKLNSIYIELDNSLANEKNLSNDWRNSSYASLNELLVSLSNIFNTDINLFDLTGHLMATSREEIFYRNLTSRRMNIIALINVETLTKSEYIQTERVGRMDYLSVYVPLYNADNKVLAYLNLPYFRMQSILAREISNLVVVVINFTLLLILVTMGFAVFLGGRLTSPLLMLGDGLASVKLGKKVEHLSYNGTDEIAELVNQYNRMVDELEESTHKLANSEREHAWREMAKQIAHEIKNPLTPMKLNVQQLVKSWKDGPVRFKERLEDFARNQVEYIDSLSAIASAFSSFAKMPGTNPVDINLLEQIKTTLELFRNTDNVTFWVRWPHESKVFIYADKEHLNGIFSNLFKNSIQSIPAGRKGLIKVSLEIVRDKIIASVADNGSGIPEALQNKLFTPNFTTKSSGMGLGLSIVKRYVEGANGRIWFESEADKGTTFHIEFPLKYTVENPRESNPE